MLLSLVYEFRETDSALYNLKGVDGCAHVKELALRSSRECDSSLLGCTAISHVVLSYSCILCNTQFHQIHTDSANLNETPQDEAECTCKDTLPLSTHSTMKPTTQHPQGSIIPTTVNGMINHKDNMKWTKKPSNSLID
jgi:hypothetical protein